MPSAPADRHPLRWIVAGAAVVALATTAWLALRPDAYVAAPLAPQSTRARPDLAAATLLRLQQAITAGDAAAASGLGTDAASSLLGAAATNAAALDVTDFSLRYVDEATPVDGDGNWQAVVEAGWRFGAYDASTVHEEITVGFRLLDDAVSVASLGGGGRRTPLWLTGPLQVRSAPGVLVLASTQTAADRYERLATRAVGVVSKVVTGWAGPLVVEVPASESALDEAVAAEPGDNTGVAAVTATVDGSSSPEAPIHVFVNPDVMDGLDRQAAQIVMSHEATHAATNAPTNASRPLWLTEGFADYVALRDVGLPLTRTAGQILAEVRRDGPPDALPDQADFDPASDTFGAVYEAAWLVCVVLAEQGGEPALVALYDRVGAGEGLDAALGDLFGLDTASLTRLWRQHLSDWAE
ncbi:hypothetical protein [Nocardioides sp.]|uniref:hypothetical protein n=1 Tax=Nocardioides sp. TaxID=35761 RepID=UPI0039E36E4F